MTEVFDDDLFETRLESLKDTQEGIQQMSSWCLQQRKHNKKIVVCWLNVFKRVRVEHRLTLFYLANDVIQYSKRKRYEFVESWATALQRATTMVRDEKVKSKILRIFKIWEQREIYSEEYIADLCGLLNINTSKKAQTNAESTDDFQNVTLITHVRECVELANSTDRSFKKLPKTPHCDMENFKQQLKDKSHSEDIENEIDRYIAYMEAYNNNLAAEIKSRKAVVTNLEKAIKFYSNQRGEVKVVVSAYKNFGTRIKQVKKKLDEVTPNLPSPIPSPDINAPSPEPDTDLQLPDEQSPISLNMFKGSINGYSSYLDGNLPFDINDFKSDEHTTKTPSQPIEVIGSRSDDESYTSGVDYYKPESISVYSSSSNISIPGLNPMPVPAVQSGYTSLARSAQQYSAVLPPQNPHMYSANNHDNNINSGYSATMMPGYAGDTSYLGQSTGNHSNNSYPNSTGGGGTVGSSGIPPIMPPPLPPAVITGDVAGGGNSGHGSVSGQTTNSSDDFNSTWNMNMSWTPLTTSSASSSGSYNVDTPVSPQFELEAHNVTSAPIEYSEHNNSVGGTQDVDHRQILLPPAFTAGIKLGISKEKTRQLDIDHRNLISLTGSPGTNEQNFPTNKSGDVDYRNLAKTAPSAGNKAEAATLSATTAATITPPSGSKKSNSPQKSNASSSSESQKDDGMSRYDPTDMVVDMDMSDEDLDEILRDVNEQQNEQVDQSEISANSDEKSQEESTDNLEESQTSEATTSANRPALLDTPAEYMQAAVWDTTAMGQMNMPEGAGGADGAGDANYGAAQVPGMNMQSPQAQGAWNQMPVLWQNGAGNVASRGMCVPPPPRPPMPLSFQYGNEYAGGGAGISDEYGGPPNEYGGGGSEYGAGVVRPRGRGWMSQSPYRNFSRPPRGAGGYAGSPYFNRGGRGGMGAGMRGGFRGKFRGNASWI